MVTEPRPSLSARAIAAAATRSTLRPWRGPRRESAAPGSRQSNWRVRAGSPALLCSVGMGTSSRALLLYEVHCTTYTIDCRLRSPTPRSLPVQITASAVSLNVADEPGSAAFLTSHFGFRQEMAADGFASLAREDAGMNVVFLRRGLPLLPEDQRDIHADGVILAFVVDNLEAELARLIAEGVPITMPLREEPWGERAFQVTDPNGVIIQLLDWNAPAGR